MKIIRIEKAEVEKFREKWPGSGMLTEGVSVVLGDQGDLIGIGGLPMGVDGCALAALITDARLGRIGKVVKSDSIEGIVNADCPNR